MKQALKQPGKTRGKLLDAAWQTARYYRAHDFYGSETRALKALQRRCAGFTARQYRSAFRKAVELYDTAVALIDRHADALGRQTDVKAGRFPDFRGLVDEIRKRCPGFWVSTYRMALGWIFFWHYLK